MSAYIRLTELDLGTGTTHVSTDYQISTTPTYEVGTIVSESIDDSVNLTYILFNITLDPTIKYYGRSRVRLNTGYTAWSNIDIFTPKDINDIKLDIDIPSVVAIPTLTLSHDVNLFPLTGFDITVSGFGVVGTAVHYSTTYMIETIIGDTIWTSENNVYNKTAVHVNSVVLKPNTVYRVKVIMNSSSNDSSQIATSTIRTMSNATIQLTKPLSGLVYNVENTITLISVPNVTEVEYNVYNIEYGESILVYTNITTTPNALTIPVGTLNADSRYFISIKTNLDTEYFYSFFGTY